MPRPTYNHEWEIVLAYDEHGEPVRSIAYRLQVESGQLVRFAVALRIRGGDERTAEHDAADRARTLDLSRESGDRCKDEPPIRIARTAA